MKHELPPGVAVGRTGFEAAKLALQVRALCEAARVNTIYDLPPDQFANAMQLQARIDAIRHEQREALVERGRRGLAQAHAGDAVRAAARLNEFRKAVAARGGLAAVNKVRLGRELGLSRTTVQKLCKLLREEQEAGPPKCPACGQRVPEPEVLSVEADVKRANAPVHNTQ
jgi:hypothetical protein